MENPRLSRCVSKKAVSWEKQHVSSRSIRNQRAANNNVAFVIFGVYWLPVCLVGRTDPDAAGRHRGVVSFFPVIHRYANSATRAYVRSFVRSAPLSEGLISARLIGSFRDHEETTAYRPRCVRKLLAGLNVTTPPSNALRAGMSRREGGYYHAASSLAIIVSIYCASVITTFGRALEQSAVSATVLQIKPFISIFFSPECSSVEEITLFIRSLLAVFLFARVRCFVVSVNVSLKNEN